MAKETYKGKLVREYILKFPKASKRSIAKKLYEDYPIVFRDIEDARTMVRSKTGSHGKYMKEMSTNIIEHKTNFSPENPFGKNKKK